jgi:CBS domain containing-hemolysin-like protein
LGHAARRASPRADMRLKIEAFENARVDDVMVPRAEIVALEVSTRLEDVLKLFAEAAHSRLPLYRETLDDPIGMVHIKDVVAELSSRDDWPQDERLLPGLRRDILFVPASMRLTDLLVKMQSTRIHLALVVDEYGGTDGLVSIEDLVEQIVGEIEDEHDEELALIVRRGRGLWEADAKAELDEVEAETGFSLMLEDFEDEVDTLGGIVIALAGRVPQRGEIVPHPAGFDLEVLDADPRRIKRLRLRQTVLPEAPPAVMTTKGATG